MADMAAKWEIQATIAKMATVDRWPLMSEQHSAKSAAAASQVLTLSEVRNSSSALTAAVVIARTGELGLLTEIDFILGVAKGGIQKRPPVPLLHPSKLVAGAPTGTERWPYIWPLFGAIKMPDDVERSCRSRQRLTLHECSTAKIAIIFEVAKENAVK